MKSLAPPPRIKFLEAISAVAGDRIKALSDEKYEVVSSDSTRVYSVWVHRVGDDVWQVCSTDNGTVYRGYVGYPIIAALIMKKALPYDEELARSLSNVPWKLLNEKYKRYYVVERIVKSRYIPAEKLQRLEELVTEMENQLKRKKLNYVPEACNFNNKV